MVCDIKTGGRGLDEFMFSLAGGPFCERKSHLEATLVKHSEVALLWFGGLLRADAGLLRRPAGPLTGSC